MSIEERVDQTVEQSMSVRERLLRDLAALDAALRAAEETARLLPDNVEVKITVKPKRRPWWRK